MSSEISRLKNLGGKSQIMLADIGVHTRAQLAEMGSLEAYKRVRLAGHKANIIFVYAIEGALIGTHWNNLPPGMKEDLKRRLEEEAS